MNAIFSVLAMAPYVSCSTSGMGMQCAGTCVSTSGIVVLGCGAGGVGVEPPPQNRKLTCDRQMQRPVPSTCRKQVYDRYFVLAGRLLLTTATSCSTSAASVMLPSASFSRASLRVSRALSISTKICTPASKMLHACGPTPKAHTGAAEHISSLNNISEMPSRQRCSNGRKAAASVLVWSSSWGTSCPEDKVMQA